MGIRNWVQSLFGKAAGVGGRMVTPFMQGRPYVPDTNYFSLVKKYTSWVYACARINATSCAQIPLRLYSRKQNTNNRSRFRTMKVPDEQMKYMRGSPFLKAVGDVEEVLEHPFIDLMANVNEFMNAFDLLEGLFTFQDLTGNMYWQVVKDGLATPNEIWPLMPQFVKIIPDKEKYISHYEFKVQQQKYRLEPEEVVHFKHFSPTNAFYGYGALQAAIVAADLGVSMNVYETSLMQNRAQPDFVVVHPVDAGEPTDDQIKKQREMWHQVYGGQKNAGKMGFLYGGADIKKISLSPKEMGFLKGRQASLNEVAAIFGVPMSKLTVENVNRANAEAGEYAYMKDTVLPRLRKVEQKLNEQLLPMFDSSLFCAFDNPVPADRDFRLKQIESHLKVGYTTINEERQIDGMEVTEYGDVPYMPMNLVPLNSVATLPEKTKELNKKDKSPRRFPPLNHPTNFVNAEFEGDMRRFFREVRREILRAFDDDADNFKRYTPIPKGAEDYVSGWFDKGKWSKELDGLLKPHLNATLVTGGTRSIDQFPGSITFDSTNHKVVRALEVRRTGTVQSATDTIVKGLRKDLAAGIANQEGVVDLRKRVDGVFENLEKYQATNIARTESVWAWNEGVVQGYVQSGVVEKKEWSAAVDERTCEFCEPMDGKIVGVEENYFDMGGTMEGSGGGELNFDYEDVGHPPLHPQCRCAIIPVI